MLAFNATLKTFFDRKAVLDAVDRAERRVLSKMGAFVRTRARSSMRKRKKASAPGTPPSSHVGTLKRLLFFGLDPAAGSVVIGPVLFGARQSPGAPEVEEYGGRVVRRVKVPIAVGGRRAATRRQANAYKRLVKAGRIAKQRPTEPKTVASFYPPRPFMRPAFKEELRVGLPKILANCVTR